MVVVVFGVEHHQQPTEDNSGLKDIVVMLPMVQVGLQVRTLKEVAMVAKVS